MNNELNDKPYNGEHVALGDMVGSAEQKSEPVGSQNQPYDWSEAAGGSLPTEPDSEKTTETMPQLEKEAKDLAVETKIPDLQP